MNENPYEAPQTGADYRPFKWPRWLRTSWWADWCCAAWMFFFAGRFGDDRAYWLAVLALLNAVNLYICGTVKLLKEHERFLDRLKND